MNKVIHELLQDRKFKEVQEAVNKKSKKKSALIYPHSPLHKTPETELFERIVHHLLEDYDKDYATRKISFSKDSSQNTIITLDTNLITSEEFQELQQNFIKFYEKPIDCEKIALRVLLDKVNFNHLSLNKTDIQKYADLFTLVERECIGPAPSSIKRKIPELEYGEVVAINRYTYKGDYYMNALLRDANVLEIYSTPMAILDSAIAAHGLNKLPDIILPHVIRFQGKETLPQLLKNVEQGNITQEKSFISTSKKNLTSTNSNNSVKIIFNNIRGKDITPISQYQYNFNSEEEYLIPPSTQVEWTGYSKEKDEEGADLHIVTAQGSNVLIDQFKELNKITEANEFIAQRCDISAMNMLYFFDKDKLEKLPFILISALVDKSTMRNISKDLVFDRLKEIDFPVSKLTDLPVDEAIFFTNHVTTISKLHNYEFPVSKLTEMPFDDAKYFLEHFHMVYMLNMIKFPVSKLTEMPFDDAKYFLENSRDMEKMVSGKILKMSSLSSAEAVVAFKKTIEDYKGLAITQASVAKSGNRLYTDEINLPNKSSSNLSSVRIR